MIFVILNVSVPKEYIFFLRRTEDYVMYKIKVLSITMTKRTSLCALQFFFFFHEFKEFVYYEFREPP
jgi:hypothetical protein